MLSVKTLAELAKVDASIYKLEENKDEFPNQLKKPFSLLNTKKLELSRVKNKYDKLREHLSIVEDQKEKLVDKLSKIQELSREATASEYQKILREQLKIKKDISFVEKRLETSLEKFETIKTDLERVNKDTQSVMEEYETIFIETKDQIADLDDEIAILNTKRDQLIGNLDSEIKTAYLKSYKLGKGKGVAFSVDARCNLCNVKLPPNFAIKLQKHENLINCPSCGRIIISVDND